MRWSQFNGKFVNAKYYMNDWSAVSNGTYDAAGGFIALDTITQKLAALEAKEAAKAEKKRANISVKKRSPATASPAAVVVV